MYGQQETKRYKETKERIRREKRRRASKNLPPASFDEEDESESLTDSSFTDTSADIEDDSFISSKFITVDELDMFKNRKVEKIRKPKKQLAEGKVPLVEKRKPIEVQKKRRSELLSLPGPSDVKTLKQTFRDEIKSEIAKYLLPYREESCINGRITCDEHYQHLINKVRIIEIYFQFVF